MLRARYAGADKHLGRDTLRFDLRSKARPHRPARYGSTPTGGYIVEAELGLPNHMEYKDFRLKLEKIEDRRPVQLGRADQKPIRQLPATIASVG